MPEINVTWEKDVTCELKHPITGVSLGSIRVDIKSSYWQLSEEDGWTKEECKVLEFHKDVYCYSQKAQNVPKLKKGEIKWTNIK
jgi:hypothetical protein